MTDPKQSAAAFIVENVGQWLQTRAGLDATMARFAAKHIVEIMWPYVLNDAYGHMAEHLRTTSPELADVLDEARHDALSELLLKTEGNDHARSDDGRTGGEPTGAPSTD